MSSFLGLLMLLAPAAAPSVNDFDISSRTVIARFHAEGAQIYACSAKPDGGSSVWTFREPIAALIEDGKTVGRHFAGPNWELDDGSLVQGRMLQSLPGRTTADIPRLRLEIVKNRETGRLAQATEVYRQNTHSGALTGACDKPGELRSIPYSADYTFMR